MQSPPLTAASLLHSHCHSILHCFLVLHHQSFARAHDPCTHRSAAFGTISTEVNRSQLQHQLSTATFVSAIVYLHCLTSLLCCCLIRSTFQSVSRLLNPLSSSSCVVLSCANLCTVPYPVQFFCHLYSASSVITGEGHRPTALSIQTAFAISYQLVALIEASLAARSLYSLLTHHLPHHGCASPVDRSRALLLLIDH